MSIFNLPDLGEGLPDAEIHEWFINEGDSVTLDQPLGSMETAKAVVDVPSPQAGIVMKLYGKPGDIIQTGMPLIEFQTENPVRQDKGTVVGNLEEIEGVSQDDFIIGAGKSSEKGGRVRATPMMRQLAKKLQVDINSLKGSGEHGVITREDIEKAAKSKSSDVEARALEEGFEPLRGSRRSMLQAMIESHQQVVPVSIFDEADIQAWRTDEDISVRLIQAISLACQKEPTLNAWFDGQHQARKCFEDCHLGLAIDSDEGLFVPVIHQANTRSAAELRQFIDRYKVAAQERKFKPEELKGATITLSNFGKFAGRFASPIIVPPMVAIIAVGRLYETVVIDKSSGKAETHRMLPLSLSFDHRGVTGGEATRFLKIIMESLEKSE